MRSSHGLVFAFLVIIICWSLSPICTHKASFQIHPASSYLMALVQATPSAQILPLSFFELANLFISVQLSHSVMSDSRRPHGPQHARPPCPSQTPVTYSNSCPLSRWCHPTISSSVFPFSSCLQPLPGSGSFQMSQFSTSGGQSTGVSPSASVLSMNIQDWFPLGWLICTHILNLITSMNPLTWTRSTGGVISMNTLTTTHTTLFSSYLITFWFLRDVSIDYTLYFLNLIVFLIGG